MKLHEFHIEKQPNGQYKTADSEAMSSAELQKHLTDMEMQRVRYELNRQFNEIFGS